MKNHFLKYPISTSKTTSLLSICLKKQINADMKKVNRKVQGMPQSQTAANPRHQEEEKKDKNIHAQNKQQMYEKHKPAPSSPSEVIRMLKQTEKRGQRAREDFKTLSAPWYNPQSYTELRTTPGPLPLRTVNSINYPGWGSGLKIFLTVDKLHLWSRCNS